MRRMPNSRLGFVAPIGALVALIGVCVCDRFCDTGLWLKPRDERLTQQEPLQNTDDLEFTRARDRTLARRASVSCTATMYSGKKQGSGQGFARPDSCSSPVSWSPWETRQAPDRRLSREQPGHPRIFVCILHAGHRGGRRSHTGFHCGGHRGRPSGSYRAHLATVAR